MSCKRNASIEFTELQKSLNELCFKQHIIYWSKEDERFIIEESDLADCMANVATPTETLENAELIIKE